MLPFLVSGGNEGVMGLPLIALFGRGVKLGFGKLSEKAVKLLNNRF